MKHLKRFNESLIDSEDSDELFARKISGNIEMGICQVMLGFRVRIGYIGKPYTIDYCVGDNHTFLEVVYSLVSKTLESGYKPEDFPGKGQTPCFINSPFNDPIYFKALIKLAGSDYQRINLTDPRSFLDKSLIFKK